jgi:hypothetical protein
MQNFPIFVDVKTTCAGDTFQNKEIEKTILRILGFCAFSHSLGRKRRFGVPPSTSGLP